MKRIIYSVFIVLALVTINITISTTYAATKVKIFKVTKVSPGDKLHLRAWPSPKSRIKSSLPYNAKDLTETGKKRVIGKTTWLEVNWNKTRGWVNGHYLKKTGVLLHATPNTLAKHTSRNIHSNKAITKQEKIKAIIPATPLDESPPQEFSGDRYDQPVQLAATEIKTAFSPNNNTQSSQKQLSCSGSTPNPWHLKMNMADKVMRVQLSKNQQFNIPIKYHEWASPTKVRMNLGGHKGRNIVDVNLEKTDACSDGLSRKNYTYEINATINRQFYSGCCGVVSP